MRHPAHALCRTAEHTLGLDIKQFIFPAALSAALRCLIADSGKLSVGREADAPHAASVGQVVHHIRVFPGQRGHNEATGIDGNADAVAIAGLSQVFHGQRVVLRSQLQLRAGLLAVDEELIVGRAFHTDGALHIVAVIDEKAEHAHTLRVGERGQQPGFAGRGRHGIVRQGFKQRCLVELLTAHVHRVGGKGLAHGKGSRQVKLSNFGLFLRRGRRNQQRR